MRIACGSTHIPPQSRLSPPMSRSTAIHSSSFRRMWQLIYIRRWAIIRVHTHTHTCMIANMCASALCVPMCAHVSALEFYLTQFRFNNFCFSLFRFFFCIFLFASRCRNLSASHLVMVCIWCTYVWPLWHVQRLLQGFNEALVGVDKNKTNWSEKCF